MDALSSWAFSQSTLSRRLVGMPWDQGWLQNLLENLLVNDHHGRGYAHTPHTQVLGWPPVMHWKDRMRYIMSPMQWIIDWKIGMTQGKMYNFPEASNNRVK
jgi:hypothetical protein